MRKKVQKNFYAVRSVRTWAKKAMKKTGKTGKPVNRLNITLSDEDYRSIVMEARVARRGSMKEWVQAAIREKLGRKPEESPLDRLPAADRARVGLCVELLTAMEHDGDLRAGVDAVLSLAERLRKS